MTTSQRVLLLLLHTLAIFTLGFVVGGVFSRNQSDAEMATHLQADAEASRARTNAHANAIAGAIKEDRKQRASSASQGAQLADNTAKRDVEFRYITKDVIRYVTQYTTDPRCADPRRDAEFVRLWNAAATGQRAATEATEGKPRH